MLVSFCKIQITLFFSGVGTDSMTLMQFLFWRKKESSFLNAFVLLRYENSSMSEEQIMDLVAETLAAVGLKVCLQCENFHLCSIMWLFPS
jgi:hypothetical protein